MIEHTEWTNTNNTIDQIIRTIVFLRIKYTILNERHIVSDGINNA